jgi:hypothetical protein
VQQIVRKLLQAGIVRESHSEYASPIVLVKKKKTTVDTIVALHSVFQKLGKPRRIIADRAAAFTSIMF